MKVRYTHFEVRANLLRGPERSGVGYCLEKVRFRER